MNPAIEEILSLDDIKKEIVSVPEWGKDITVVSMSAEERSDIEKRWGSKKNAEQHPAEFKHDVLSLSVKKDNGEPWGTADQFKQLMKKNGKAIDRLFDAALKVSGYTKEAVEEIAKN